VKGNYNSGSVYGPSLSTSKLSQVRQVVQSFKDNYITKGMSDYDKAWMAFCYLRANCDYAWRGWQYNGANTAWGALVYGEAQCSGYARAMKALCDAIGVKCYYVHANSKASNPSHQWNMVRVGGKWYILDAQGGFFLVGSQTYQNMVGMRWDTKGLPTCSKKDHAKGGFVSSEI
jgi:transglutaminase/protease-like cytokinesis protein 3